MEKTIDDELYDRDEIYEEYFEQSEYEEWMEDDNRQRAADMREACSERSL